MRLLLTSTLVVLSLAAGLAQQATFRSSTRIVPVLTTVIDAQGRLVPNLEQDQFTILDNGKPQEITFFQNDVQPFTVVVILDFSASMTANLDRLKNATEQFLLRMLPADKGQVGAFSDKIQFSGTFTNDRDELISSMADLQFGNPTRLFDAIDESILLLEEVEGRKVVLAFTDGDDTASRRGMGDVLDHAKEKEVMIYSIGLESEFFNGVRKQVTRPDRGLRKLADETGGGYFELRRADDLGFAPAVLDNKEHKLEVKVKQSGHTARARRSYTASDERLSSPR
jgi:Ca-activated chloride channel family protein